MPRIRWEGAKEGYYFTTGFRGTGYYLDARWCDYNDCDEEGYALARPSASLARSSSAHVFLSLEKADWNFGQSSERVRGPHDTAIDSSW